MRIYIKYFYYYFDIEGWLKNIFSNWISWSRQEPQATNIRVRKEIVLAEVAKRIQHEKKEREEEERVEQQKERDKEERKKRKLEKKMAMSKARCNERMYVILYFLSFHNNLLLVKYCF